MKRENVSKEISFEIVKHFASVLHGAFRWISCYTKPDGSGIIYRTPDDTRGTMTGSQVIFAGRKIENDLARVSCRCGSRSRSEH